MLTKIRKDKARQLFNEGKELVIVGDNVNQFHFFNGWHLAHRIKLGNYENTSFDSIINNFEFYLERELGRRTAYYLESA